MITKTKWLVLAGVAVAIVVIASIALSRNGQPQHFTATVERGEIRDVVEATFGGNLSEIRMSDEVLNRIRADEQRSFATDRFRRAPGTAESEGEVDGEQGNSRAPRDEQPTPLRGTLPPITAGRANQDGLSVFGYEK
jgi:hypothetical protein